MLKKDFILHPGEYFEVLWRKDFATIFSHSTVLRMKLVLRISRILSHFDLNWHKFVDDERMHWIQAIIYKIRTVNAFSRSFTVERPLSMEMPMERVSSTIIAVFMPRNVH